MNVRFVDDPNLMTRPALLNYVDNLEGWLRELIATPDVALRLQRAFGLAPAEARVLAALADGREKSRTFLRAARYARPNQYDVDPKVLDVCVCTLRAKVKPFGIKIETIHSVGYVLTEGGDVVAKAISG